MGKKIVIVGGVAGGASVAARSRRLDESNEIVMFERGPHVSFSNCCLPYHLSGKVEDHEDLVLMKPEQFFNQYRIDARVFTEVVFIDRENKEVTVRNVVTGKEYKESYDKLILSPGAKPIVPPIPGINNADIFTVRNVVDIDNLNKREEGISREKISHYMNTIKRSSNRLIRLIDNIINTSKIESGSYKLNIKEYDIVYLVEELALSMKDYIEEQGIELIIDPDIEEKIIQCDCSDIEKVIMNLISNAVKFTPKGGVIEVRVSDYNECVKISVKDTGIGIDGSKHKSIFNRFDQAYNSTSEEFGGSGLGLTLSKQLVELHGGTIEISSEVGKGSEFIVILPVKQENKDIIEYSK